MTTELNRSRIRAQVLGNSRKRKPATLPGKRVDAVAMWKRALAKPCDQTPAPGGLAEKTAMWRKAVRGGDSR